MQKSKKRALTMHIRGHTFTEIVIMQEISLFQKSNWITEIVSLEYLELYGIS